METIGQYFGQGTVGIVCLRSMMPWVSAGKTQIACIQCLGLGPSGDFPIRMSDTGAGMTERLGLTGILARACTWLFHSTWASLQHGSFQIVRFFPWQLSAPKANVPVKRLETAWPFMSRLQKPHNMVTTILLVEAITSLLRVKGRGHRPHSTEVSTSG
jgi:hypothetical protein